MKLWIRGHEGYPDFLVAYQLDAEKIIHQVRDFQHQGDVIETEQKSWLAEATKNYSEWNSEIIEILCVRNNALAVLYPRAVIFLGIIMLMHLHTILYLRGQKQVKVVLNTWTE